MSCIEYVIERSSNEQFHIFSVKIAVVTLRKTLREDLPRAKQICLFLLLFRSPGSNTAYSLFLLNLFRYPYQGRNPASNRQRRVRHGKGRLVEEHRPMKKKKGGEHKIIPVGLVYPLPLYRIKRRLLLISLCPGVLVNEIPVLSLPKGSPFYE